MRKLQFAAALSILLLCGCAGQKARTNVLWPEIELSWPLTKKWIDYGIAEGNKTGLDTSLVVGVVADMDQAFQQENEESVRLIVAAWPATKPWLTSGILAGVRDGLLTTTAFDAAGQPDLNTGTAGSITFQVSMLERALQRMVAPKQP